MFLVNKYNDYDKFYNNLSMFGVADMDVKSLNLSA